MREIRPSGRFEWPYDRSDDRSGSEKSEAVVLDVVSTFAERRKKLMDRLPGTVAVFASAPVVIRNNDVEHEYRQDSDFYYLTGFTEPESVLILSTEHPDHSC